MIENFGASLHQIAQRGDVASARIVLDEAKSRRNVQSILSARDLRRLTPLHIAAANGMDELVALFLEFQSSVNALDGSGETALHKAATRGHPKVCEILLQQCLQNEDSICVLDSYGQSALYRGAHKGHLSVVEVLLRNGSTYFTDVLSAGFAALHAGHPQITQFIIRFLESNNNDQSERFENSESYEIQPRTLPQLKYAVREWQRTAKVLQEQNKEMSHELISQDPDAQRRADIHNQTERDVGAMLARLKSNKKQAGRLFGLPEYVGNMFTTSQSRRLPLSHQIRSHGAVKLDSLKHKHMGEEEYESEAPEDQTPAASPPLPQSQEESTASSEFKDGERSKLLPEAGGSTPGEDVEDEQEEEAAASDSERVHIFNFEVSMSPCSYSEWEGDEESETDGDWSSEEEGGGGGGEEGGFTQHWQTCEAFNFDIIQDECPIGRWADPDSEEDESEG